MERFPPSRPIVFVALAHLAGLALGFTLFPLAPRAGGVYLILALAGFLAGCFCFFHSRKLNARPLPVTPWLLLALAALGAWQGARASAVDARAESLIASLGDSLVQLEGVCAAEPTPRWLRTEIVLRDVRIRFLEVGREPLPLPGRVVVSVRDNANSAFAATELPVPGQRIRASGWLRGTRAQTAPSNFPTRQYWRSLGIAGRLSVSESGNLELGDRPHTPAATTWMVFRAIRNTFGSILDDRLTPATAPLARSLLLGEAYRLDDERRADYRRSGMAHFLAVSGMHTGFLLLILLLVLRAFGLNPRVAAWIAIAALIFYALLTGLRPPVTRAAFMGVFLLLGYASGRPATGLAALATAAFFSLVVQPLNILRVDWQLSHLCVLSILLAAPPLIEILTGEPDPARLAQRQHRHGWLRNFLADFYRLRLLPAVAVIAAAQLGILPFQLYLFGQAHFLAPLSSIAGSLFTFLSMTGMTLLIAVSWIPFLSGAVGFLTALLLDAMNTLAHTMSSLPGIWIERSRFPLPLVCLYYLILFGGLWLRGGRAPEQRLDRVQRFQFAAAGLALFVLLAGAPLLTRANPGTLDLFMLDVGQGDAMVVRFPNGQIMVIDAGKHYPVDYGKSVVAPFLESQGIETIDVLVATHADADHIGGLPHLMRNFPVRLMVESHDVSESEIFAELGATGALMGAPVIVPAPGDLLTGMGGVGVAFLGPVPGLDDNDASVIILLDYGEVEILLPGDAEAPAERWLLGRGLVADIDVLKLGHHGSRGSSTEEFLRRSEPEIGLISAGRRNRYGHPAPEVLERAAAAGARVFRTDTDGSVLIRTDGKTIQMYGFGGKH